MTADCRLNCLWSDDIQVRFSLKSILLGIKDLPAITRYSLCSLKVSNHAPYLVFYKNKIGLSCASKSLPQDLKNEVSARCCSGLTALAKSIPNSSSNAIIQQSNQLIYLPPAKKCSFRHSDIGVRLARP